MMVSRVGFGGIPIQRLSEDEAVAVVRGCLDLGITYIDTHTSYTTSEERIGKALLGRRDRVFLATKSSSITREGVESQLKQSLKHLGVESIDLYQFSNISKFDTLDMVLNPKGPMAVVEEAKRAGQVKHIGISSHQIDVAKEAVKSDRFETIMFPFNVITCEAADELLPLAREHDVGFIAMKPLHGGMIQNVTIAFKYLFQFPDVVPIPGTERVQDMKQIVNLLEGPRAMTELEQREMQRLRDELGTRFCRRCDECLPCPEGVPIAAVMDFPLIFKGFPPAYVFSGHLAHAMEEAANCDNCGDCEERCSYKLPIRELIAEYTRRYETGKRKYQERVVSR